MAIVIREIYTTDTVNELIEKLNYNFDQIVLNGGGMPGQQGLPGTGIQGVPGEDGSSWFYGATDPALLIVPYKEGDFYVLTQDLIIGATPYSKADVFYFDGSSWVYTTLNIRGPEGSSSTGMGGVFVENENADVVNMVSTATFTLGPDTRYKTVIVGPATDLDGRYVINNSILASEDSNLFIYEPLANSTAQIKFLSGPMDILGSNIYSPILLATAPTITSTRRYSPSISDNNATSISDLSITNSSGGHIKMVSKESILESELLRYSGTDSKMQVDLQSLASDSYITFAKRVYISAGISNPLMPTLDMDALGRTISINSNEINLGAVAGIYATAPRFDVKGISGLIVWRSNPTSNRIQIYTAGNSSYTTTIKESNILAGNVLNTLPPTSGFLLNSSSIISGPKINVAIQPNEQISISLDPSALDGTFFDKDSANLLSETVSDFDLMLTTNIRRVASGAANAPSTGEFSLNVLRYNTNVLQNATSFTTGMSHIRYSNDSGATWSAWGIQNSGLLGEVRMIAQDVVSGGKFDYTTGLGNSEWLGWALCDGRNSTADLRGRVPLGYTHPGYLTGTTETDGAYHTVGNTGGIKEVLLTGSQSGLPSHSHSFNLQSQTIQQGTGSPLSVFTFSGATNTLGTNSNTQSNAVSAHENRQPFTVIVYAQKIV